MAEFTPHPAELWLLDNWPRVAVYNFEWIAVAGEGLIDHAPTLEELLTRLEGSAQRRDVLLTFVSEPEVIGDEL